MIVLIIFGKSSRKVKPAESTLYDPSLRQDLEALGVITAFDDFQSPAAEALNPVYKLTAVTSVGPDQLK